MIYIDKDIYFIYDFFNKLNNQFFQTFNYEKLFKIIIKLTFFQILI